MPTTAHRSPALDRYFRAFEAGTMPEDTCATPMTPDTAALNAVADRLDQVIETGDPDQAKALLRILIAQLRVNSRSEILPTYSVGAPVVCAQTSSVGIVGALSNPSVQEKLGQLSAKLGQVAASGATPRPSSFKRKRQGGVLTEGIRRVLAGAQEPMRMCEIHTSVEVLLGESVPRSTIKNCLANNCQGARARFERVERGRYRLVIAGCS
jgi:hypothetical protein